MSDVTFAPLLASLVSAASTADMFVHSSLGAGHPQSVFAMLWRTMCERYTSYTILTYGSFMCQLCLYIGLSLPSLLFAFVPFMRRYKLQQARQWTWKDQAVVLRRVMMSKIGLYLPLAFALHAILKRYDLTLPYQYESMPAWYELAARAVAALWLEDTWHYWLHRLLHHPRLYGRIHKVHHQFSSPFALTSEYAHPIETAVLGVGFFIPTVLLTTHLAVAWFWLLVRMSETIDVHSGYDCWWVNALNPLHYLPFYGGAKMHDEHHAKFDINYASTFTFWDQVCGTNQLKTMKKKSA